MRQGKGKEDIDNTKDKRLTFYHYLRTYIAKLTLCPSQSRVSPIGRKDMNFNNGAYFTGQFDLSRSNLSLIALVNLPKTEAKCQT